MCCVLNLGYFKTVPFWRITSETKKQNVLVCLSWPDSTLRYVFGIVKDLHPSAGWTYLVFTTSLRQTHNKTEINGMCQFKLDQTPNRSTHSEINFFFIISLWDKEGRWFYFSSRRDHNAFLRRAEGLWIDWIFWDAWLWMLKDEFVFTKTRCSSLVLNLLLLSHE